MRATARDPATPVARFAGSQFLITTGPRVALAKPRSTLGYMLTRASRVGPTPQNTPDIVKTIVSL